MFILAFITIFIVFCLKKFIFPRKRVKDENGDWIYGVEDIPGDKPFLGNTLVGNLSMFLPYSGALENGNKYALKHGGIFKIIGANQTFVGFYAPSLVQQLFRSTEFGHNIKSPIIYDTMKPFISNGVLVSTRTFWQGQRKLLMKTQSFQNLKLYMKMLNTHCQTFIANLEKMFEDGKPHQINEQINVLFLRVICEMITGQNVSNASGFDRYHHNFQLWKESLLKRLLEPWLLYNPIWRLYPMSRKQDRAIKEMMDFAKQKITEHKKMKPQDEECYEANSDSFRSVLDELVDAGVSEDQIVDEINTMLFGGHETGASTLHFFCFSMALNPDIQRLCQQEIDEAFDNPKYYQDGRLTFEAASSGLKYLERCIQETLRLYPAVFLIFRKLESEIKVVYNNRTYSMPAGMNIAVCPYVMHRNPEQFPNPEKFDPDRFLPEQVLKRHPFAFVPYSGGPRSCLGMKFAQLEMKLVAAYLLRNFEIMTTDKIGDIAIMPFITLTPEKDYTFAFKKRIFSE